MKSSPWQKRRGSVHAGGVRGVHLSGVGDEDARFKDLGHHLMCVCGCSQVLLSATTSAASIPTACAES